MKLKLNLTKGELEAMVRIAKVFIYHSNSDRLREAMSIVDIYSFAEAFRMFCFKVGQRLLTVGLKERNKTTLTDMETLAFYHACMEWSAGDGTPYEAALSWKILEEIDRKLIEL